MPAPRTTALHKAAVASLVGCAIASAAVRAQADCDPASRLATCIDADTFWPHPGPARFLAVGGTETTAAGQLGFGLVTSWLSRPIVLHAPSADPKGSDTYAVDNLVDVSFLWSVGITDRLELGAAIPTSLYESGSGVSAFTSSQSQDLPRTAVRDARFGLTYAILPHARAFPNDGFGVAGRLELGAPVGNQSAFAGDRSFVGIPSVGVDYRAGRFFAGAELGARLRKTTDLVGARVGSQLVTGLGVGADIFGEKLGVAVEAFALPTLASQAKVSFDPASAERVESDTGKSLVPAEWMASLRSAPIRGGDFSAVAGGGGAIPLGDSAITAPRFRVSLALRYAPLSRDTDADGVLDKDDLCPGEREDKDGFQDDDGCPDPDNDKDGIPDTRDRCRDEPETVDGFEDEDGCPDLDDDKDGIPDEADKCRMEPEDRDGFEDEDGCPDPDNDKDGVPDTKDRCPNAAEDKDGYQDDDGCPDPDNDLDGIPDGVDKCPNAAEDKDGYQDDDGCPEPDNDEDGVLDGADKCPTTPETIDGKDDADGCPEPGAHDKVVWKGDDVVVLAPARFAAGDAKLTPALKTDVAMIAQRARGHVPLASVIVEAYADQPVDNTRTQALAGRRADALKQAFVEAGIPADILTAAVGDLSQKRPPNAPPFDVHVVKKKP